MNEASLRLLLEQVRSGELAVDGAIDRLQDPPFRDLGEAVLDNHRELRRGQPEVIYCAGKTVAQIKTIVAAMLEETAPFWPRAPRWKWPTRSWNCVPMPAITPWGVPSSSNALGR